MSDELNNLTTILQQLYAKYTNNEYILSRIKFHITNLENVLEMENKKNDVRIVKYNELSYEQDNFCKVFLNKHQYYHIPYNSLFYEYDNKHYRIVSEDEIYHTLLSSLTNQPKLAQWKHKTKLMIIKQIKETHLLKSTPESYTIQSVLNIFSSIFENKIHTKYFLTIIGDCILKKCSENKYFINQRLKKLVLLVNDIYHATTGFGIMNNFISKYHENHKLSDYRLIKPNSNFVVNEITTDIIKNFGIDIMCVACYYSDKYGNSDNYISNVSEDDQTIQSKILYFKNNSSEEFVLNQFTNEYITQTNNQEATISWKNLHYLWLHFLNANGLPNVIYSDRLKELLVKKYNTNEDINKDNNATIFNGITSKYLPSVSNFLKFWEKYIHIPNPLNPHDFCNEYDIDELIVLYKSVNAMNKVKNTSINEKDIIHIMEHYFCNEETHIQIIDNKIIIGMYCTLWNKAQDIKDFLYDYKTIIDTSQPIISFGDLYNAYKVYVKAKSSVEGKHYYIVNKQYFETFIHGYITDYILYDTFVSCDWFTNI